MTAKTRSDLVKAASTNARTENGLPVFPWAKTTPVNEYVEHEQLQQRSRHLSNCENCRTWSTTTLLSLMTKITISGFSDLWIETILPSQVDHQQSKPTVTLYNDGCFHIGHFRLVEFTSRDFAHLQQTLLASGLSPSTVRHARRTLSACLNQAVRMGNLKVKPSRAIPPNTFSKCWCYKNSTTLQLKHSTCSPFSNRKIRCWTDSCVFACFEDYDEVRYLG